MALSSPSRYPRLRSSAPPLLLRGPWPVAVAVALSSSLYLPTDDALGLRPVCREDDGWGGEGRGGEGREDWERQLLHAAVTLPSPRLGLGREASGRSRGTPHSTPLRLLRTFFPSHFASLAATLSVAHRGPRFLLPRLRVSTNEDQSQVNVFTYRD